MRRAVRGRRHIVATASGGSPTLIGISGFVNSTNFYQGNVGEGPPGFTQATAWVLIWDSGSGSGVPFSRTTNLSAVVGWCFTSTSSVIRFRVGTGAAGVLSPNYTWTAGDQNAWTVFHGVIDVSGGRVKLFRNGVEIGSPGTSLSAYSVDNSARPGIGCRTGGGDAFTRGDVGGCGMVDVAMTPAQIASHYSAIVAAGKSVLPGLGTTTWNYDTNDAAATWPFTGTGANGNLTRTGSLIYTPRPLNWSP